MSNERQDRAARAEQMREQREKADRKQRNLISVAIVFDAAAAGGKVATDAKPVSVELCEDFQCPACRAFEQQSGEFLSQQVATGAITVTDRPFSFLDELGASTNDYSKRSTNVALCVLDQEGPAAYKKVHDYLYANQPEKRTAGPSDSELLDAMKGLGFTGVDSCVKTEKFIPWIKRAKAAGQEAEISSTPAVKVAGKVVENPTPQTLQAAIAAAAKA